MNKYYIKLNTSQYPFVYFNKVSLFHKIQSLIGYNEKLQYNDNLAWDTIDENNGIVYFSIYIENQNMAIVYLKPTSFGGSWDEFDKWKTPKNKVFIDI